MIKRFNFLIFPFSLFMLVVTTNCRRQNLIGAQKSTKFTITVDLSAKPVAIKSMTGFLHGINHNSPDSNLIADLKPAYWRAGTLMNETYTRINGLSVQPILVVSDLYNYAGSKISDWQQPFENKQRWTEHVAKVYMKASAQNRNLIYDIWNEPNIKSFWTGSKEQFFETFKLAHDRIRSLPNGQNAMIAGPSIAYFDKSYLHAFLEYCLLNKIKLDVLTWHDFRTGSKIPSMTEDLLQARNEWVNSSRYAPLQIKAIHINETISQKDQVNPAAILAILNALEKGKADGACKACWDETSAADNNCLNYTLDGLLTPKTHKKRSAWWAYYYYSQTTQNRLTLTSSDASVVCFAAVPPKNNHQIMLLGGYFDDFTLHSSKTITVSLKNVSGIPFLREKNYVTVTISKIPFSGFNELPNPVFVSSQNVSVTNGYVNITVPDIRLKDGFVIQIE